MYAPAHPLAIRGGMAGAVELYAHRGVMIGVVGDLAVPHDLPVRLAPANVRKRDLLLVATLDQLPPPRERAGHIETTTVAVAMSVGPYFVLGSLHLPIGARL